MTTNKAIFQPSDWSPKEVLMSFFKKPITNHQPQPQPVSLLWVYQYVKSEVAATATEKLRMISDKEKARDYKAAHFDYVTPSGVFNYSNDTSLVKHSGVLCMDLDYLGNQVEEMFQKLLADEAFTTLLLFRSPSGHGLKWFIHIDLTLCDHRMWFKGVRNYLLKTYSLNDKQVDSTCSNLSRACFLGYDPDAYLLSELKNDNNNEDVF